MQSGSVPQNLSSTSNILTSILNIDIRILRQSSAIQSPIRNRNKHPSESYQPKSNQSEDERIRHPSVVVRSLASSEEPWRDESTNVSNTDYETTANSFLEGTGEID